MGKAMRASGLETTDVHELVSRSRQCNSDLDPTGDAEGVMSRCPEVMIPEFPDDGDCDALPRDPKCCRPLTSMKTATPIDDDAAGSGRGVAGRAVEML